MVTIKKLLYYILKTFLILFTSIGLIGIIIMLPLQDFTGIAIYAVWTTVGCLFLFSLHKHKNFFFNTNTVNTNDNSNEISNSVLPTQELPVQDYSTENSSPEDKKTLEFPDTYIAFDVETPNKNNDRISYAGILLVCNGEIIKNYSTLINPETRFDHFNTVLTGIDASAVCHAPTFKEYWPSIEDLFKKYVIIAHNANFDLSVLSKTLLHYGLKVPPIKYVCTYNESRNKFPQLGKYSLKSMAEYFDIPLENHHDAKSDAQVCSSIFEAIKSQNYMFTPKEFEFHEEKTSEFNISPATNVETFALPYSLPEFPLITGMRFVLTGIFTLMPKDEIVDYIETNGGKVTSAVSGVTNYLIVGSEPEPAWKHGNYGSKIEKALSLISENNKHILFIKEEDFISFFASENS
ncbi:hypothetical protein HMPREF0992_00181 [Lachnospiraceae bacterium 6_1_63FAA]|nr:hypothetical protein HMPREF0992_00181 [Lachnospiraceae bacterium 6_1_63FAA]